MTYDDWKLRSDRDERPEEQPARCVHMIEMAEHCGICDEPTGEGKKGGEVSGTQTVGRIVFGD